MSTFSNCLPDWLAVINLAGSIYTLSKELQLSLRWSIADQYSVVGEDTASIITAWCCTTVGGGSGWEEVHYWPECLSMMRYLALCFLTFIGEAGEEECVGGGVGSWHSGSEIWGLLCSRLLWCGIWEVGLWLPLGRRMVLSQSLKYCYLCATQHHWTCYSATRIHEEKPLLVISKFIIFEGAGLWVVVLV
jgi:hypothetical protein